ncbi:Small ubiquitin-related modifier 2 [Galemys pyrenaicus]|uniref:Small ubiquitin-related modifier 2 n=1 Tax=Galemys pyrenaicus TaxID=202257 RepID=A0A8J6AE71_GALPY|nr:Small ubiquitin-related modifier 2 [Galemys pyrenaicus]
MCAGSVRSWYLFCEAAAEETPALAMADEKPKEGVKTENNDHINLKVAGQDGSVVQFKIKRHTPLSKLMKAYCERQGLSMRQIRFRFDGQPINETDTSAQWKWRMKIQLMCSSSRQEGTEKGTCYFTPELCSSRPRRHSQLENRNLVPPHPDYYSIVFSILSCREPELQTVRFHLSPTSRSGRQEKQKDFHFKGGPA